MRDEERVERREEANDVIGSIPITELQDGGMEEERGLGEVHWRGVKRCCYLF